MNEYIERLNEFYSAFGNHKAMVLSTSQNGMVSSRMVSVVLLDGAFYFQTDKKLKKYNQIKENQNVALCIDNISIQGICCEAGLPINNERFCRLYKEYYPNAYEMYSGLEDEVLFFVMPAFIQKWIYEEGKPYTESWDFTVQRYEKKQYNINR